MEHSAVLSELLILLCAIVLMVPLFQRLGIGSIPGYLVAGSVIGPPGLALIDNPDAVRTVSEFGVVFLLFSIGIELKPSRLWVMRRQVFGLGTAQVVLNGAALTLIALALGIERNAAIVAGFGLALSSTAFVLQMLAEKRQLGTSHGRHALAILLLQDIAVVPLITLVYLLAGEGGPLSLNILFAVLESAAVLGAVILAGRYVLPRALSVLAGTQNRDVFAAAAVLLVLGAAWLLQAAGLSMALGAFLAGLLLANSSFRHQIVADIHPFRGFLLGFFFLSVGMSLDMSLLGSQFGMLMLLLAGMLIVNFLITAACSLVAGANAADAMRLGTLLAQGGEFAFILFALAASVGVMPGDTAQFLLMLVVLSMLLTPALAAAGERLARRLALRQTALAAATLASEEPEVIIAGFGRVGRQVSNVLRANGVRSVAIDRNHDRVAEALREGYEVIFGDTSRPEILRAAGIEHARLVLLTLDDVEAAQQTAAVIAEICPQVSVVARARDRHSSHELAEHGVRHAIPETTEYSLQLGLASLRALGQEGDALHRLEEKLRADEYHELHMSPAGTPKQSDG